MSSDITFLLTVSFFLCLCLSFPLHYNFSCTFLSPSVYFSLNIRVCFCFLFIQVKTYMGAGGILDSSKISVTKLLIIVIKVSITSRGTFLSLFYLCFSLIVWIFLNFSKVRIIFIHSLFFKLATASFFHFNK